ncbi:MAG TPA: arginine--tRNA ligase, partial [Candidatus Nitrosotenuis sp.]|nr:arginine--tRNA ligase [Candidatus Nitrosotenuis sp.]
MKTPRQILSERMAAALLAAYPTIPQEGLALIFPTPSPDLGDYQCNRALQMARQARVSPRVVAEQALARASFDDLCQTVEIAGPGFINFRLRPEWVGEEVRQR